MNTQELMIDYATKYYYDDDKIIESIQQRYQWDTYKHGVVGELLSPRSSPRNGLLSGALGLG